MRGIILAAVASLHLLLLDAATKEWAIRSLRGAPPVPVVDGFFDFAYVENRGCAWGMFQGSVWPLALFSVAAFAFLAWKRREFFRLDAPSVPRRRAGAVAECMIYAGIAGNLIDRAFRGYVVDFIDLHWGANHFPCFNVADICITLAAACLVALSFGEDQAKPAPETPGATAR